MKKLSFDDYYQKVLEFLPEKERDFFEGDERKGKKITSLVLMERLNKFGELKELAEEGAFDYYFNRPKIDEESLIFKDGSLEESKKYLSEVVEKIENIKEED